MRKFFSLSVFHLRLFARNGYFFWLMVSTTVSVLLLQYVASYAAGSAADETIWLRAGIFGLWSCATTAAGAIGFQRFQGTLPYLLNNVTSDAVSLAALIVPASSFGLLSFPLSWLAAKALGITTTIALQIVTVTVLMLWIGAIILDFGIAALFVFTPNAIVYEDLITIPILLAAGLFGSPPFLQNAVFFLRWILPIAVPIQILLGDDFTAFSLLQFSVSSIFWLIVSGVLGKKLLDGAKANGKLGVM